MNKKKIRVLHFISSNTIGGAERLLLTLFNNIDRENFDPVLGIFVGRNEKDDLLWKEAEKFNIDLEPIYVDNPYNPLQIIHIYRIVKKHHPDIIHTHGYKTNILAFFAAKILRIPIVTTVHGLYTIKLKTDMLVQFSLLLLKHFDKIIAVSDQIKTALENKKIPSGKISTIKNIPPDCEENFLLNNRTSLLKEIGIPPSAKVIGFIGRLERVKGCEYLLQALPDLVKHGFNFHLVIAGEGPERNSLEKLSEKLNVKKYVNFIGYHKDIRMIFRTLELCVLPSLNEGIPLTMLEAMSFGIPVIATEVGGIPEVIRNEINGILVPPMDTKALTEAIAKLLRSPDKTKNIGLAGKNTINNEFNKKIWIKNIQLIYRKLAFDCKKNQERTHI